MNKAEFEQLVRKEIKKARRTMQDVPGMPATRLPLEFAPALNELIADGKFKIVERPRRVNPKLVAKFIVEA